MPKRGIKDVPRSLFDWQREFNDDLGFEATHTGAATDALPGSFDKIAVICERMSRGQALWNDGDSRLRDSFVVVEPADAYQVVGDKSQGSVIGVDAGGGKHRYATWMQREVRRVRQPKWLYVIEHPTKVDSWDIDDELYAIREHAAVNFVATICVVSLYTVRVSKVSDLADKEYPVTSLSLFWARWLARYCDKVVACWGGQSWKLNRDVDMLWLLSRTTHGGKVWIGNEFDYPGKLTRFRDPGIKRFDCRGLIAERQAEDEDIVGWLV